MTVAQQLPKGLKTETEILAAGFALMKEQFGLKSARYYFYYNEDYPSDLISEYNWLHEEAKI